MSRGNEGFYDPISQAARNLVPDRKQIEFSDTPERQRRAGRIGGKLIAALNRAKKAAKCSCGSTMAVQDGKCWRCRRMA